MHHVLLVGCTGTIGQHITNELLTHQYNQSIQLTLLVRHVTYNDTNSDKSILIHKYQSLGAKLVFCDLLHDTLDTIVHLLSSTQCTTIISMISDWSTEIGQLKLIHAAIDVPFINWFIPSEFASDKDSVGLGSIVCDIEDCKIYQRQLLRDAAHDNKLSYTIICSGLIMEYYMSEFGGVDINKRTVTAPGNIDVIQSLTCHIDNTHWTCNILNNGLSDDVKNKIIYYAGDTISYRDTHQLLELHTNHTWLLQSQSIDELLSIEYKLRQQGHIRDAQYVGLSIVVAQQRGVYWPIHQSYHTTHNLPATSLQTFIEQTIPKS